MDKVPKRDRSVNLAGKAEMLSTEIVWGLAAREMRSFVRMCIYSTLCMVPSAAFTVFWFLGRGEDL